MRLLSILPAALLLASPSLAQIGGLDALPPDLASYLSSVMTDSAIASAIQGVVTAAPVQAVVSGILAQSASVDQAAYLSSLNSAASAAIAAAPADQQSVARSVVAVVTSLAAKDGLVSSIALNQTVGVSAAPTGYGNATAGATGTGARSGGGGAAATVVAPTGSRAPTSAVAQTAAAPASTSNPAAQPTGLALGALVGVVAGVAALL